MEALKDLCEGGLDDALSEGQRDVAILERHLLKPLSRDAIADESCQAIAEVGTTSIKQVGLVIRQLIRKWKAGPKVLDE